MPKLGMTGEPIKQHQTYNEVNKHLQNGKTKKKKKKRKMTPGGQ